jgi:hypothetical protein
MRFEDRVMVLCGEALAADDAAEVRAILTELRLILHQRIEQLRGKLRVAYSTSMIVPQSFEYARQFESIEPVSVARAQYSEELLSR